MTTDKREPVISVGLMEDVSEIYFELASEYRCGNVVIPSGTYQAYAEAGLLHLVDRNGNTVATTRTLTITPLRPHEAFFSLHNVKIGKQFHWERSFSQMFNGSLSLIVLSDNRVTAINTIPLETYLISVISSEMSPDNPGEFLKAHSVIARSWLIHQIHKKHEIKQLPSAADYRAGEVMRWTDRVAHKEFDVCADDHCQRYQGLGKVNDAAVRAVEDTRGEVLMCHGDICDARYSKCCGGITENFSTAWEDKDVRYLQSRSDAPVELPPITDEHTMRQFVLSRPRAYCNISDRNILQKILPDFDFETQDFFRWKVCLPQEEIGNILLTKTGIDFGEIKEIVPVARGPSGRLCKIRICGTRQEKIVGKELEIRRVLSATHLLSSAFVVEPYGMNGVIPKGFFLYGAGWGHGVGLCQIGASGMAKQGIRYRDILRHYFTSTELAKLY